MRTCVGTCVMLSQDYRLDPENALRAEWEKQSRQTIVETTKPCPKCNAPTEKSGELARRTCLSVHFVHQ